MAFKQFIMKIHKSKTIWFSYLLMIFGIIEANSKILEQNLTPEQYGWALMGIAVITATLRFVTNKPLAEK